MVHSRSDGFIKKKLCYRKRTKSCCLSTLFIKEKKQLRAPIITIKDLVPPTINIAPQSSDFDRSSSISTSIHSYFNLNNLEEQMHVEECPYCSSESAVSIKTDPNNNHLDQISIHSLNLLHAVEMYLSSNPSLNEQFDISSISSHQYAIMNETKQLNLCEINEIIYAIHSTIDNNNERNETLDALASSLREVAEETPIVLQNENRPPPHHHPQDFVKF